MTELIRGDKRVLDLTAGQSLSGKTVRFTAKYRATDTTAVFSKSSEVVGEIDVTDVAGGLGTVTITKADWEGYSGTGPLVYDVEVTDGDGEPTTVLRGTIVVLQDVSR